MKIYDTRQQENEKKSCAHDLISQIIDFTGLNKTEISEILGVTRETIYNASNEKGGSRQLMAALKLLLELQQLKKALNIDREIAQLQQQRAAMTGQYPAPQSSHLQLNDAPSVSSERPLSPAGARKLARARKRFVDVAQAHADKLKAHHASHA